MRKSYLFSSGKEADGTYWAYFWDGSVRAKPDPVTHGRFIVEKAYFSTEREYLRELFGSNVPVSAKSTGEMRFENMTEKEEKKLRSFLTASRLFLDGIHPIYEQFNDYLEVNVDGKEYFIEAFTLEDKPGDSVEINIKQGGTLYESDNEGGLHIVDLDNSSNLHPTYTPMKSVRFGVTDDGTIYFWEGRYLVHDAAASQLEITFVMTFKLLSINSNVLICHIRNKNPNLPRDSIRKIRKYFPINHIDDGRADL